MFNAVQSDLLAVRFYVHVQETFAVDVSGVVFSIATLGDAHQDAHACACPRVVHLVYVRAGIKYSRFGGSSGDNNPVLCSKDSPIRATP